MTREELMTMPHLDIAEIKRMVHIHTEEGWYIAEGMDDIKEFAYTNCLYLPIKDEYLGYAVISAEDVERYQAEKEKALEEEFGAIEEPEDEMPISGATIE